MADEHAARLGRLETAIAQLPEGAGIERRRALLAGDGGRVSTRSSVPRYVRNPSRVLA